MVAHPGEPDASRGYRLVVRSIGTADAAVIGSLRQLRPATDLELAALLYQAPSELLAGLDVGTGTRLVEVLRGAGLDVGLVPAGEPFSAGAGDFEVALVVKRFDAMLGTVEATMRVLGLDLDSARKMVCATPAPLIGRISAATVSALRERFAPLGAELDESSPAAATFDVAAEAGDEAAERVLAGLLPHAVSVRDSGGSGRFLAVGLDAEAASVLWSELTRTTAKVRILNRDFQRFDVKLQSAPRTPAMTELLVTETGMSEAVAARALGQLPFVLAENVRADRMTGLLDAVHVRGGRAVGVLLALTSFGLALKPGGDRAAAHTWVEAIAGKAAAEEFARGGREPAAVGPVLRGPLTKTQARWLQHALRGHGISARLVER